MWQHKIKATSGLAALLLIGLAGCAELEVKNPNAPDAERALGTSDDTEALIAGAYDSWLKMLRYSGPTNFISVMSFEHSSPWANFGHEYYGRIPRIPSANVAGGNSVSYLGYAWTNAYRAISAVRAGQVSINEGTVEFDAERTLRIRAYVKFMQGLAHASLAMLYDSAFIYDETMDAGLEALELKAHGEVMTAALGYFAEAATLAGSGSFEIPDTWMPHDVPAAELAQLAHSMSASYRVAVARTPTERRAVDWGTVIADINAGVTADWINETECWPHTFCESAAMYRVGTGWSTIANWVLGMADQSGGYQAWINTPTLDKLAFIYDTPDLRFPQGATEAEQYDNPGVQFSMNKGSDGTRIWSRPDRGTWRWSYYWNSAEPFATYWQIDKADIPMVTIREMQLLRAEKAFYDGDMGTVATIVNETRVAAGLNATDAAGLNTSCVPKLPNSSCGNLWEMFKWEKRLETQFRGPLRVGWWMDGRGWGDLMEGTLLELPVPFREMQLLLESEYNLGGVGGVSAAPLGTYGY